MSERAGFGLQGEQGKEENLNPDAEPTGEKLIPGKLIGFRRFSFKYASGTLTAVSNHTAFMAGANTAEHIIMALREQDDTVDPQCATPVEGCTCGFYGYYTPDLIDITFNSNVSTCCAVVEVWGKVILGTKGFRAQKMRILGVVAPKEVAQYTPTIGVIDDIVSWSNVAEHQAYYNAWGETVRKYGVTEYSSIDDMVKAHPPQDVSHLIPKPDPERYDDYSWNWGNITYTPVMTPAPWTQKTAVPPSSFLPVPAPNFPVSAYTSCTGDTPVQLSNGIVVTVPAGYMGVSNCTCLTCQGARAIGRPDWGTT